MFTTFLAELSKFLPESLLAPQLLSELLSKQTMCLATESVKGEERQKKLPLLWV